MYSLRAHFALRRILQAGSQSSSIAVASSRSMPRRCAESLRFVALAEVPRPEPADDRIQAMQLPRVGPRHQPQWSGFPASSPQSSPARISSHLSACAISARH